MINFLGWCVVAAACGLAVGIVGIAWWWGLSKVRRSYYEQYLLSEMREFIEDKRKREGHIPSDE